MKQITMWLSCGIIAAGLLNASIRREFCFSPEGVAADQSFSIMIGVVGGPAALLAALGITGFGYSGWTLSREYPCKEKLGEK